MTLAVYIPTCYNSIYKQSLFTTTIKKSYVGRRQNTSLLLFAGQGQKQTRATNYADSNFGLCAKLIFQVNECNC